MGMMKEFTKKKAKKSQGNDVALQAAMQAIAGLSEQVAMLSEQLATVQSAAEGDETK